MQQMLWALVLLYSVSYAAAGTCKDTSKKPTLTTGQTWVPDSGCSKGGTYDTNTTHCHCWSFCGYICDPNSSAVTTTTSTAPTTTASSSCASKRPSSLPSGSNYTVDANCPKGNTYQTPTANCHCWSRCGYICDPK